MDQAAIVDCLQYANWSRDIFREMRLGGVHAVHATIAYHETFREMVRNIEEWLVYAKRLEHYVLCSPHK